MVIHGPDANSSKVWYYSKKHIQWQSIKRLFNEGIKRKISDGTLQLVRPRTAIYCDSGSRTSQVMMLRMLQNIGVSREQGLPSAVP